MKKFILFIVCIMLSISAGAYSFVVNGIYYTISGNNVSVTSGDVKYTGSIAIPSTVTYNSITYPVTSIAYMAFGSCSDLTSVIIPSSVTSIGQDAFYRCTGLSAISIPSSITSIENYTFEYAGLKYIIIPSSVISIGSHVFNFCTSLTTVTIPASVSYIGNEAFWACSALTSVYVYRAVPLDLTSSTNVFYGVNKTSCTLYVPNGTKSAYQGVNQWKDFTNMSEFVTAVPSVSNERISIYPNPVINHFSIDGVEGTSNLRISDLNGKMLIDKQVSMNENVSISNLTKGMYLIQLINNGNICYKKIIKK